MIIKEGTVISIQPEDVIESILIFPDEAKKLSINVQLFSDFTSEALRNVKKVDMNQIDEVVEVSEWLSTFIGHVEEVTAPKLRVVPNELFYSCRWMKTVNLDSTKVIEAKAFAKCDSLSDIKIPFVEKIGSNAFAECKSLKYINLPSSLNSIGVSAFRSAGLVKIYIPSGAKFVESFTNCKDLEEVFMDSFSQCDMDEENKIEPFYYCDKLKVIYVRHLKESDKCRYPYTSEGKSYIIDNGKKKVKVCCYNDGAIVNREFNVVPVHQIVRPITKKDAEIWALSDGSYVLYAYGEYKGTYGSSDKLFNRLALIS